MTSRPCLYALLSILFLLSSLNADDLKSLPEKALKKSQLTQEGARPFHLKAVTDEQTNADNDVYNGTIEEWWAAPDRFKRIVKTSNFTQVLIVNGAQHSETTAGDYYPNWMRTLVEAIFNPGERMKNIDLSKSGDNPMIGGQLVCRRFGYRVGKEPDLNTVFASFCFKDGLVESVQIPGYHASYTDYKKFGDLQVARNVREYIENGTEAEAKITELSEWTEDKELLKVDDSTPLLQTIQVPEQTLRSLSSQQEIAWPAIRAGKTKGTLSIYVCIDRNGVVQEQYDLNSDNPNATDAARAQLMNWRFTPAVVKGERVQVEGILTFAFNVAPNPLPVLNDAEARKQFLNAPEPNWPSTFSHRGIQLLAEVNFDDKGKFKTLFEVGKGNGLSMAEQATAFHLLRDTLSNWTARPYMENGRPTEFKAYLLFRIE